MRHGWTGMVEISSLDLFLDYDQLRFATVRWLDKYIPQMGVKNGALPWRKVKQSPNKQIQVNCDGI